MITTEDVNKAYDAFETAFKRLAELENKQSELVADLAEYKDGSRKADQIKKRIEDQRPKMLDAQREYRMAGMRVDRLRVLLDVEKIAVGQD